MMPFKIFVDMMLDNGHDVMEDIMLDIIKTMMGNILEDLMV